MREQFRVVSGSNAFYLEYGDEEVCLGDGVDRAFAIGVHNREVLDMGFGFLMCDDLDDPLFCEEWAEELATDPEALEAYFGKGV